MDPIVQITDSEEVIVLLTLQFRPGTAEKVLASVVPSIRPTRAEAGNNAFHVFNVKGSADKVVIFERWKSQSALEEHWKQPYTEEAMALFREYLVEPLSDTRDVLYLTDVMKPGE
ncbi:hypothetical protein DYU11_01035 [Fibrisoma montanum]|uniref:ABM domain-containing protein n=1 Tax=Fibrisoma montanum TaxID=2305895 RepID=A0A418MHP5_9BACT|nr:antibiotic biosynthesis monooxygenase [Fibrisoma montanum]RIV26935.1 hypothetical protein DYU11_01035 [Fibrisoma montanum]